MTPTLFDLADARNDSDACLPATVENALDSLHRHGLFIIRSGIDPTRVAGLRAKAQLYADSVESAVRAGSSPLFDPFYSYSRHMLAANLTALDPDTAGDKIDDFSRTSFCKALLTDLVRSVLRSVLGPNPAWISARARAIIPNHDGPNGRIRMHTEKAVVPYKYPGLHNIWSPLVPDGVVTNRDVSGLQFLIGDKTFFTDISDADSNQRLYRIEARTGGATADPDGEGFFYRPKMRIGDVAIFSGSLPHGTFVPDAATATRVGADLRVCPLPDSDALALAQMAPNHRPSPLDGC